MAPFPQNRIPISSNDAKDFLEVSQYLESCLKKKPEASFDSLDLFSKSRNPEEVPEKQNPKLEQFLQRMRSQGALLSELEMNASLLVFQRKELRPKFQDFCRALGFRNSELSQEQLHSCLRVILTALACCSTAASDHPPHPQVLIEGKPHASELSSPPHKKIKREQEKEEPPQDPSSAPHNEIPCQSPSFDSSLATLRDEEDTTSAHPRDLDDAAQSLAARIYRPSVPGGPTTADLVHNYYYKKNHNHHTEEDGLRLLNFSEWKSKAEEPASSSSSSPESLASAADDSPTLVSFDFSGSKHPLCVNISEDNLKALKYFVERTKIMVLTANDLSKRVQSLITAREKKNNNTITKDEFKHKIPELITESVWSTLSEKEQTAFTTSLLDIFSCFQKTTTTEGVALQDFAMGFSFFASGSKSSKLMCGFELVAGDKGLTEEQLNQFVNSYLTMLVAMGFLVPVSKQGSHPSLTDEQLQKIRLAVDDGARWTIGHYLKDQKEQQSSVHSFEQFATWYSSGGYGIAPWLELLDLNKMLALLRATDSPIEVPKDEFVTTTKRPSSRDRLSSLRRHHARRLGPPPEILFNFPFLAGHKPLIVLKEDAAYVRGIIDQLGFLNSSTESVWSALSTAVAKYNPKSQAGTVYVDMRTFVKAMMDICSGSSRKRSAPGATVPATDSSLEELLSNFFECFDLEQVNQVALDELMGGLSLLCGGKKSSKLAFAFTVFDTRPRSQKTSKEPPTLCGEDLFLFLRSILIVTFSCCRQSLDMADAVVGRCIADTSNMICNDVMRHHREKTRRDRLSFDEFGQWYNDGGFERAPWLELLDLRKWVLIDSVASKEMLDPAVPPPPPEEELDAGLFDDTNIMPMDSMDDMDMILMQNSMDHLSPKLRLANSFSFSPKQSFQLSPKNVGNPLKFHLMTNHEHGGYMVILSNARIQRLGKLLSTCATHEVTVDDACSAILAKASRAAEPKISRSDFESVVKDVLLKRSRKSTDAAVLTDLYKQVFDAFDKTKSGKAIASELACGVSLLCKGKKSDKLEYAFDILDRKKAGHLTDTDLIRYMESFLKTLMTMTFSSKLCPDSAQDSVTTLNGKLCEKNPDAFSRICLAGSEWASRLAFTGIRRKGESSKGKQSKNTMSFDEFGSWYTSEGYKNIPWLELLDLKKWVFSPDSMQLPTF